MKINVTSISVTDKGKYKQATVTFQSEGSGKFLTKNIVSFGDQAEVFKVLTSNPTPQSYEVEEDTNSKYRNWTKVVPVANAPVSNVGQASANTSPKSNYETADERAQRQVYIIRQSSLERAIELATLNGNKKADVFEILSTADTLVTYVMEGLEQAAIKSGGVPQTGDVASKLAELESDKPWDN